MNIERLKVIDPNKVVKICHSGNIPKSQCRMKPYQDKDDTQPLTLTFKGKTQNSPDSVRRKKRSRVTANAVGLLVEHFRWVDNKSLAILKMS